MRWRGVVVLGSVASLLVACSGVSSVGPAERVRAFGSADTPIAATGVTADEGGWRIERPEAGAVPLFEVPQPGLERATLTYRARMRAGDVEGKAYLEMWVRVPGRGEFFSRGLAQPLHGTSGWASYEIPFVLTEKGVKADLVKLNVGFDGGGGTVWIKDVELLKAALGG
jgi:hypothetical protein